MSLKHIRPGPFGPSGPWGDFALSAAVWDEAVPVHVVAARLGHADPSITLRVYAHVISDQLTEAADIFARAVAGIS